MTTNIQPPRIGCGDDTMTEIETKKKRAYTKRKDCSGTNTPAVMETKKKRPYRRKDCGGDTIASVVMKKRKECGCDTTDTSTAVTEIAKKKRAYRRKKCLPHDLIVELILTRLPVPTLAACALVSKLWYNSILNDHKRLTYSHFLQSQKQPEIVFSLLNVRSGVVEKTGEPIYDCNFFRFTTGMYYSCDNILRFDAFGGSVAGSDIWELVGYCNGLPCMAEVGDCSTSYVILDQNRKDFICIFYPVSVGRCIFRAHIICHGIGFDASANEYKLVSIYRTAQKELNVVVFTLGTKLWRNLTATSMPISGPLITKIRAPTGSDKSAIFCTASSSSGGCLAWKIITTLGGAESSDIQHDDSNAAINEMEMILSFDLHDEKIQFIQLPAKSTNEKHQNQNLLVDYPHLLEFKGSPCIARIEKIPMNGSDYPHRCRDDHKGSSSSSSSSSCCCCCKVHLYVLKDKANKQVWVKEECFDVRINSCTAWLGYAGHLSQDLCCFCFGSTTTPLTRIFSYSDQMLLYWFNGKRLYVYNLHSEKRQLILPSYPTEDAIFGAKRKEPRHILKSEDDDSNMDYQLHCHEENFLSLQTFIPEGVPAVEAYYFTKLTVLHPCSAYAFINRGSKVFYPFIKE